MTWHLWNDSCIEENTATLSIVGKDRRYFSSFLDNIVKCYMLKESLWSNEIKRNQRHSSFFFISCEPCLTFRLRTLFDIGLFIHIRFCPNIDVYWMIIDKRLFCDLFSTWTNIINDVWRWSKIIKTTCCCFLSLFLSSNSINEHHHVCSKIFSSKSISLCKLKCITWSGCSFLLLNTHLRQAISARLISIENRIDNDACLREITNV